MLFFILSWGSVQSPRCCKGPVPVQGMPQCKMIAEAFILKQAKPLSYSHMQSTPA